MTTPEHTTAEAMGVVLARMTRLVASATTTEEAAGLAAPLLLTLTGASSVTVARLLVEGPQILAHAGEAIDLEALAPDLHSLDAEFTDLTPQSEWAGTAQARCSAMALPDVKTVLVLGWGSEHAPSDWTTPAVAALATAVGRIVAEGDLKDLQSRVDNAQALANMGDYDWHIATDTNRWSDQLYRIYGHEPGAFNASYERFLGMIHPEDREMITGVHQQAYASGEPYAMIERIVRPDGELRYLSSNGQVIMDANGTPVRMRGTCVDITARVLAEQARERLAQRFRQLVEVAPDAILVCDDQGQVLQANARSTVLLGGDPVGHMIGGFFDDAVVEGQGIEALCLDGTTVPLDVVIAPLSEDEEESLRAVFLMDARPRLANEALAASFREAQLRRRQAMEINDNVVQGLTAAVYAVEAGNVAAAAVYLERTLTSARRIMSDLLDQLDGQDLQPGDLVRGLPSTLEGPSPVSYPAALRSPSPPMPEPAPAQQFGRPTTRRVLVVDDSDDLRMLLRMKIDLDATCEVVGEAADGEEAIRLAAALQPDVVLLDLSMPRMDGLEALPLIRAASTDTSVIVLSGFDHRMMAEKALAAGASRYVEKGAALDDLCSLIDDVLELRPAPGS